MRSLSNKVYWTEREVDDLKKAAIAKALEAEAALLAAGNVEVQYWTQTLVEKFPDIACDYDDYTIDVFKCGNWRNNRAFTCDVEFSAGVVSKCVMSAPYLARHGYSDIHHAGIDVWHELSSKKKGKPSYRQDKVTYRCEDVIPFIKMLLPITNSRDEQKERDTKSLLKKTAE